MDKIAIARLIALGMRHGDKDKEVRGEDALSPLGFEQVSSSARLLNSIPSGGMFIDWFSSGMKRADQTVATTRAALGLPVLEAGPNIMEGLRYEPLQLHGKYPGFDHVTTNGQTNVYERLIKAPVDLVYGLALQRDLITLAMLYQADGLKAFVGYQGLPTANIFMAGHGPCLEMATPTPKATPLLGLADIIRYEILLYEHFVPEIVSAQVTKCPHASRA